MRHEHNLILACARIPLSPGRIENVRKQLQKETDWPYLLETARQHGVLPLLAWHLTSTFSENLQEDILKNLRLFLRGNAQRSLFMMAELSTLLSLFKANGVLGLPYKGPCLAVTLYGNAVLRQSGDLDILVGPDNIPTACRILREQGYSHPHPSSVNALQKKVWDFHDQYLHGLPFDREDGMSVDLHRGIVPKQFGFPLPWTRLQEAATMVAVPGISRPVPIFAPEHIFLILCAHGEKHQWAQLLLICDIAQAVSTYPQMDWSSLLEQARRIGNLRRLLLGLSLAHTVLEAPLAAPVARAIERDSVLPALSKPIIDRLFSGGPDHGKARRSFSLRVRERLWDKIRLGQWFLLLSVWRVMRYRAKLFGRLPQQAPRKVID